MNWYKYHRRHGELQITEVTDDGNLRNEAKGRP